MDLKEFFDYKNLLMKDLCSNEAIVKLVTGNKEAKVPNHQLAYTQLFPFEYVPETISEAQTFICFDVDILSAPSKTYYLPVLYIWVFTHKSNLRLPEGGLLLDELSSEIAKMLNGNRFYGLGQLKLSSTQRFEPTTGYLGRSLVFTAVDFNRMTAGGTTPSNRRRRL